MGAISEELKHLFQFRKSHSCPGVPVKLALAMLRTEGGWVVRKFISLIDRIQFSKNSKFKIAFLQ